MKLDRLPIILLCVVLFAAPIIGGQLAVDAAMLTPGLSGLIAALGGNGDLGILPHALLGVGVVLAGAILLLSRRIVQTPNQRLSILILMLMAVIGSSVSVSAFRNVSLAEAAEWWVYGITFFVLVAGAGRQLGPKVLLSAIFAGTVIVAIKGIMEYGQMKAIDPTWRIFAGWVNPNATAAILLLGFFLGISLMLVMPRLGGLICGLGTGLVGLALALTQSKGGLLAWGVACPVFLVLLIMWHPRGERGKSLLKVGAVMGLSILLIFAIVLRPVAGATPAPGQIANSGVTGIVAAPSALSRITNSGGSQDQSSGFRSLLWKGCLQLAQKNPVGYGIGAYRYESGRTGLTTQTQLAHETYLQLLVEASPLAPGLLLVVTGFWLWLMLRGAKNVPLESNLLRAGIVASVVAIGLHSLVDSDLYYFGIGLSVFAIMGIGMVLSSDSVSPEYVPTSARVGSVVLSGMVVLTLIWLGFGETLKNQARFNMNQIGQESSADRPVIQGTIQDEIGQILALFPNDPEANYLASRVARTAGDREKFLRVAVQNGPSTRILRALSRELIAGDKLASAETYLNAALSRDPNNLLTLTDLLQLHQAAGDQPAALATAQRLVDVEKSPYFQIRSLPNLIPTETYTARVPLAAAERDPVKKAKWLQEAVDGFKLYLTTTVPEVRQAKKFNAANDYAGESPRRAIEKLTSAAGLAQQLSIIYGVVDPGKAALAKADEAAFAAAAEDLRR